MVAEERGQERVAEQVLGIVVPHRDLLEHHLALDVDVDCAATAPQHHVAHEVHGERQIVVEHVRVEARVFLRVKALSSPPTPSIPCAMSSAVRSGWT